MPRCLLLVVALAVLSGCTKPDLASSVVRAGSAEELTAFRAEQANAFPAADLQAFDTALQELRLDAMNRDVATAAARETDMRAVVEGKTVRAAEILGWQARCARLRREIALMAGLLERDLQAKAQTAATGTPLSVSTHLQNEQEILTRLKGQLAEAEQRLAGWGASPTPAK